MVRGQEAILHASVAQGSAAGDFSWERLGAAMRDVLLRRGHRRSDRGEIDVVLSEGLCLLGMVKGDAGALAADEAVAIARHCFRTRLPALAEAGGDAVLRATPVRGERGQRHLLCAALEGAGYEHIRAALPGGAWSLRALRPRLVSVAAGLERELDNFSGHLACADSRAAVLVAMREGNWLQVMTRRVAAAQASVAGEIQQMLEQSEALAGTGSREVWCCGDGITGISAADWCMRPARSGETPRP